MTLVHHGTVSMRRPTPADGPGLAALVRACPPLDPNTPYCYALLGEHFADTCAVAAIDGELVAFVSGYRPPRRPYTLFVWQVGVHPDWRGHGLAARLLDTLAARAWWPEITWLETTIGPSNRASARLFVGFAERRGVPVHVLPGYPAEWFPPPHEAEPLYRIGPFRPHLKENEP